MISDDEPRQTTRGAAESRESSCCFAAVNIACHDAMTLLLRTLLMTQCRFCQSIHFVKFCGVLVQLAAMLFFVCFCFSVKLI